MTFDEALHWLMKDQRSVEAEAGRAIAAELDRLRERVLELRGLLDGADQLEVDLEAARAEVALMGASLKQQDAEVRVLRTSTEAAASKLSAKLARVEALPAKWRNIQPKFSHETREYDRRCVFEQLTEELEASLRDEPQTEREPKLPFNGY